MEKGKTAGRIASVDIFRAFTMITMLWVNDFAGMEGIPHWLHHAQTREDMMGFSDLVFPAFLFCMGLSIPFAVSSRVRKGEPIWRLLIHIGLRSFALIVMGVFALNCSSIEGGLSGAWFEVLMVIGFFLTWNQYPEAGGNKKWLYTGLSILGAGLLVFLALHRVMNGHAIETGWWGILGLIGWAYLASAIIYLCTFKRKPAVFIAWAVVIALVILNASHVRVLGSMPGGWTHIGLAFSGVATATLMQMMMEKDMKKRFPALALCSAAAMLASGAVCHRFWIISKNMATPTWMFFSLCCSLVFLAIFFWMADIKGHTLRDSSVARIFLLPAGTATLTCYTIPYFTYSVREILHLWYPHAISHGIPGLAKSLVFAFLITASAWLLGKLRIKMKI